MPSLKRGCRMAAYDPSEQPQPDCLVSLVEASEKLNVSLQTVRRLIDDGLLHDVHLRRRRMVTAASLNALLTGAR